MERDNLIEQSNALSRFDVEGIDSVDQCVDIVNDQELRDAHKAGRVNVIGFPGVPGACLDTLLVYAPGSHKTDHAHLFNIMPKVLLHWLNCPMTNITHIVCPDNVMKQLQSKKSPWREWIDCYKNARVPNVPSRKTSGIVRVTPIVTKSVMTRVIGKPIKL